MELTQTRLALSEGLDEVKRVDIHFVEHKEKFDLFSESIVHVATILAGVRIGLAHVYENALIGRLDEGGSRHNHKSSPNRRWKCEY